MRILQGRNYHYDPAELERQLAQRPDQRRPPLVEIRGGDETRFGWVRADLAEELCNVLNRLVHQ